MEAYILIIDDDQAISQGIATLLEQRNFPAKYTNCGRKALAMLENPPLPRLIVLDVMMPDLDGFTLCRAIRQHLVHIPILMLSARDETSDKILGLDTGADEYMTKPFDPDELVARIRAMLRLAERATPNASANAVYQCGALRMIQASYTVEVADRSIQLTPREWTLLLTLAKAPGSVFGRETLLRQVWGTSFVGETRVIDVLVQRLRAKIEDDATSPQYIATVRGFGYRLVLPE
ncbi:response regulator transcription factor [Candidatus Gracilibacteria bacterium]|nr:response regulator transcription factor [Candidatus Gracilibacteria bacterium]